MVAVLAGLALADSAAVALRQTGAIARLPDVPIRGFDANRVTMSKEAFPLGVPDAIPASLLYATEIALAIAVARRPRSRWLRRLVALAVGAGALGALYYLGQMALVEKRACIYCLGAIGLNLAMIPPALRLVLRSPHASSRRDDRPPVGMRQPA